MANTELLARAHDRLQQVREQGASAAPLPELAREERWALGAELLLIAQNLGRIAGATGEPGTKIHEACDVGLFSRKVELGRPIIVSGLPVAEHYEAGRLPKVRYDATTLEPHYTLGQPARIEQLITHPRHGLMYVEGQLPTDLDRSYDVFPDLPKPLHNGVIGIKNPGCWPVDVGDFKISDGGLLGRDPVDLALGALEWAETFRISDEQLLRPVSE